MHDSTAILTGGFGNGEEFQLSFSVMAQTDSGAPSDAAMEALTKTFQFLARTASEDLFNLAESILNEPQATPSDHPRAYQTNLTHEAHGAHYLISVTVTLNTVSSIHRIKKVLESRLAIPAKQALAGTEHRAR